MKWLKAEESEDERRQREGWEEHLREESGEITSNVGSFALHERVLVDHPGLGKFEAIIARTDHYPMYEVMATDVDHYGRSFDVSGAYIRAL